MAWSPGGRILRGLAAAFVVTMMAARVESAVASDARGDQRGASTWETGELVPIEVRGGEAIFRAPAGTTSGDLLVVVSSVTLDPRPRRFLFDAQAVDMASSPRVAAEEPSRPPALAPFQPAPTPPMALETPAATRYFHMMVRDGDVGSPSNYLAIKGVLKAVGKRVQVYVAEEDERGVGPDLTADIVATFDNHVYPVSARAFGLAEDVDGDGRFTILVSGRLARMGDGGNAVDGFVRVTDLDDSYPAPFGNNCDMMYLSAALRPGPHLRTVMAHEYNHAVMFTRKYLRRKTTAREPIVEQGWLDEGIAHLVEDAHGFGRSNLDHRVSAFLSSPERYRLVVDDYFAADLFRGHGNRGSTYLFLKWCVDRCGPTLPSALMESPLCGVENLEAATGRRFADLYRNWSFDLFTSGLQPQPDPDAAWRDASTGGRLIAGPRWTSVDGAGGSEIWSMTGTSSRFLVVDGSAAKAVEVRVAAPEAVGLQVSAAVLPRDLPRLSLTARAHVGADGDLTLRATVREHKGRPVRLLALGWELLVPPADPNRSGPRPGLLAGDDLAAAFGGDALAGSDALYSRPIRLTGFGDRSGAIVVKALGVDDEGRRVTAWATLNDETDASSAPAPRPLAEAPTADRAPRR